MITPIDILILEDSRFDFELLVRSLKQEGLEFNVRHAANKSEFHKELDKASPDIVLSDYELPSYNGETAFLDTRNRGLSFPFILITGALPDNAAAKLLKMGIEDYILKDRLSRLPAAIHKALENRVIKQEQKVIKAKLWKYRTRLSMLHEVSPVGIFRMNEDGNCIYVNKKWCQLAGIEKPDALGKRWINAVHPEDRQKIRTSWQKCFSEKKSNYQCDYRFLKPDGSIIWILCSVVRETEDDGSSGAYVGSITDITENTLIRQELEENAMRFKEAIEAGKTAIAEIKIPSQEFTSFNLDQLLGYDHGEAPTEMDFYINQLHPDELPLALQNLDSLLSGKIELHNDENRIRCKDGTYKWFLIKMKVTKIAEGDLRLLGTLTDIHEQKMAQLELLESKERFRLLLDNAYDEIFVIDPQNLTLTEVNNSVVNNTGYSKGELVGSNMSLISEKKEPEIRQLIAQIFKAGKASFETTHYKKNGERYLLEVTSRVVEISGKDYILAFGRDISERKKAEAEIKKLSLVASEIDNGVMITTQAGTIEWVNRGFEKMTGYTLDEIKGKYPANIFGPDDPEANAAILEGIKTGKSFTVEMFNYNKDRSQQLWIALTLNPIFNDKGEMGGVIGISTNITERKQAELALKESESRFRKVLMEAPNAVIITNRDKQITFFNHQAEQYFSYKEAEAIGTDVKVIINGIGPALKKRVKSQLPDYTENKNYRINKKEYTATRKEGTTFPVEALISPYYLAGERGHIIMMKDITEQKIAEEEENRFKIRLELKVEERTRELNRINKLLEKEADTRKKMSDILEQRNRDITSSIMYAEKLQNAMLPSLRLLERSFSESFLINRPKDIVSGDFYWFHKTRQKIMIACADCTGHGVPGAFMSMMGVELLTRVVAEQEWKHPSLVLELLDEGIINTLKQGSVTMVDGMDLSFCMIDKMEKKLHFGGAMHSIVIISEGETKVYKGSRFGLGGYLESGRKRFETIEIEYKEGDMLYMFSDGFQDQFGGEDGRKLMAPRMRNWLAEVAQLPAEEQQQLLTQKFESWMGNAEQVDDVLLIGLRL